MAGAWMENYGFWVDENNNVLECTDGEHHPDVVFRRYRSTIPRAAQEVFFRVITDDPPTEEEWLQAGLPLEDYEYFIDPADFIFSLSQWALEHGWARVVAFRVQDGDVSLGIQSQKPITERTWKTAKKTWRKITKGFKELWHNVALDIDRRVMVTKLSRIADMDVYRLHEYLRVRGRESEEHQWIEDDEGKKFMRSAWARKAAHERGIAENPIRYHVTPWKTWQSTISKRGLVPQTGKRGMFAQGTGARIYLFDDEATAEDALVNWMADEFPTTRWFALLAVMIPHSHLVDDPELAGSSYTTLPVAKENIRLVTKIDAGEYE